MASRFYALPFKTAEKAKQGSLKQVDLETSVRQNLRLLLSSMPGRFRYAPMFGSQLNKFHFRLPDKRKGDKKLEDEIKSIVQKNVDALIRKFEPRVDLKEVIVTVRLPKADKSSEFQPKGGGKIALEITINGRLMDRESFDHLEIVPIF
jgi:phage baseplate assembly protein W